jgi:hypothetical protein
MPDMPNKRRPHPRFNPMAAVAIVTIALIVSAPVFSIAYLAPLFAQDCQRLPYCDDPTGRATAQIANAMIWAIILCAGVFAGTFAYVKLKERDGQLGRFERTDVLFARLMALALGVLFLIIVGLMLHYLA